jgi:hypothetical protein
MGPPSLVSLAHSTQPLRDYLNENRSRLRLLAIVSPT